MTVDPDAAVTTILVPVGSLGAGVRVQDIRRGIAMGAHAIALDAGSTDSGAYFLATGRAKYAREAIKADLEILMAFQAEAGIPLLIGSCGQSGSDKALDWVCAIAIEIARERALRPRIALLYSQQDARVLRLKNEQGLIAPLAPAEPLTAATIDACDAIVAVMGPEPYVAAIRAGADIVLGGRTTDTAVLAAVALMRGSGTAAAWHAGKIAECGGQCTVNPADGGVVIRVDHCGFEVEPLSEDNRCTTQSVSAHMLYENSDPYRLIEPGGVLDVSDATYAALDERIVRASGARFESGPYTLKLEGARAGPFQTIMLVGVEDPDVLAYIDLFHDRLLAALLARVDRVLGTSAGDYDISLRLYGWNAVSGRRVEAGAVPPREVGVLFVATASSQTLATQIAKLCNPYLFHFPFHEQQDLPSYAFPFSPSEIERGPVYEFTLNHVVAVDDPCELVRTRWVDLREIRGADAETA